ncbi:hypothetical protein BDEG_28204 [Batrachochytrium dendrobatidis JEL423]|uniref:Uncharacterized protein n=1 Tax=Batrachochytrium dendrobatidis (strain JEL423) TaxID=403673 RepID=A0A177WYM5_BATDL|nr:hypothetical protein BDEG_28204 [Batrachochytrium dendrobatidis JEL423]
MSTCTGVDIATPIPVVRGAQSILVGEANTSASFVGKRGVGQVCLEQSLSPIDGHEFVPLHVDSFNLHVDKDHLKMTACLLLSWSTILNIPTHLLQLHQKINRSNFDILLSH